MCLAAGLCPDPLGSLSTPPGPIYAIGGGPTSKGKGGKGRRREKRGKRNRRGE